MPDIPQSIQNRTKPMLNLHVAGDSCLALTLPPALAACGLTTTLLPDRQTSDLLRRLRTVSPGVHPPGSDVEIRDDWQQTGIAPNLTLAVDNTVSAVGATFQLTPGLYPSSALGMAYQGLTALTLLGGDIDRSTRYPLLCSAGAIALNLHGKYPVDIAPLAIQGAVNSGTAAERFAALFSVRTDQLQDLADAIAPATPSTTPIPVIAPHRQKIFGFDHQKLIGVLTTLQDENGPDAAVTDLVGGGYITGPKRPIAMLSGVSSDSAGKASKQILDAVITSPQQTQRQWRNINSR